jgi:hypothetical protein
MQVYKLIISTIDFVIRIMLMWAGNSGRGGIGRHPRFRFW